MSLLHEATERQVQAASPVATTWVAANAGAGKTYTLANRVARLLMVPGTKPERILCLTFTKAAAAEMQARLFRQLGEWAMLPDKELRAAYERELTTVAPPEFLGKVVRWYYARDSRSCIVTDVGNLVAKTEGCSPMMQLTPEVPDDLDYEWYIREAAHLLRDAGVLV